MIDRSFRLAGSGLLLASSLALAGCATTPSAKGASVAVEAPDRTTGWRAIASDVDVGRLARLSTAWREGLAAAKGSNGAVREEGVLLEPDAGLVRPEPTPGSYQCRLVTLGQPGQPAVEKFKPFFCYVEAEGEAFTIVKQTGSQRPAGRLYADDGGKRLVFLGSLALGGEDEAKAYGDDPKRDMAGVFERIGPFHWRLVIPYPQDKAKLDVFDLTPVAEQPE